MKRLFLPAITIALITLVAGDKVFRGAPEAQPAPGRPVVTPTTSPRAARPATDQNSTSVGGRANTATIERLARLAIRRQLGQEGSSTYLDSLIVSTDSLVRRWPDRSEALTVAIIEGGPNGYSSRMAAHVRDAFDAWEDAGVPLRFTFVTDTTAADITVHWIDNFNFDRAGQTDLTWDQMGHVRHASIALALRTSNGIRLPDHALLSVAIHEVGHALGLPHSADSNDVMFPATRTGAISKRDRRTALLLYQLPPGSVRDSVAP
jgi:predicted Zn-dependent protease